jgi:hypothetical protein
MIETEVRLRCDALSLGRNTHDWSVAVTERARLEKVPQRIVARIVLIIVIIVIVSGGPAGRLDLWVAGIGRIKRSRLPWSHATRRRLL